MALDKQLDSLDQVLDSLERKSDHLHEEAKQLLKDAQAVRAQNSMTGESDASGTEGGGGKDENDGENTTHQKSEQETQEKSDS